MGKLKKIPPEITFLKCDKEWMNIGETAQFLGVARSTVTTWRDQNEDFPKPMVLSAKKISFNRDEILEWATDRMKDVK